MILFQKVGLLALCAPPLYQVYPVVPISAAGRSRRAVYRRCN